MDNNKIRSQKSRSKSPNKIDSSTLMCEVILLDPTQPNCKVNVNVSEKGSVLFNKVCDTLGGILEQDYFGLKYIDRHGQQRWLELTKPISKQLKDKFHKKSTQLLSFRFKHYPKDPVNDLQQDLSKYLLYLQLRRDLFRGRLVGVQNDQYRLAALILQAEIGGYDMVDKNAIKILDLKILPFINRKAETRIMSIYETFKHLDCQEAERQFLMEASKLETYGVEPVPVKDQKGSDLFVGITYEGVSTFSGSKKVHTFPWQNILKLSFSHKLFMFQVVMDQKKHILGFKCETSHAACALWTWALDRKDFFTLDKASEAIRNRSGGSLFRRKKSHIFAGRSQRELTKSCQTLQTIPQPHVVRAQSMVTLMKRSNSRSESATVNGERLQNGFNGYATLPRSQGRKSYRSDSSDDGEGAKKPSKENIISNKCNSAAVGAVLDFMQALKETPDTERRSVNGNPEDLNGRNSENSSLGSDRIYDAEDRSFLCEMANIVEREQASLLGASPQEGMASEFIERTDRVPDNAVPPDDSKDGESRSILQYTIISVILFSISLSFGLLTVLYIHINESPFGSSAGHLPDVIPRAGIYDMLRDILSRLIN